MSGGPGGEAPGFFLFYFTSMLYYLFLAVVRSVLSASVSWEASASISALAADPGLKVAACLVRCAAAIRSASASSSSARPRLFLSAIVFLRFCALLRVSILRFLLVLVKRCVMHRGAGPQ